MLDRSAGQQPCSESYKKLEPRIFPFIYPIFFAAEKFSFFYLSPSIMASKNNHFVLPDSTPRSSKLTINIAGFRVHLYGVQELSAQQREDTTVLFHIHGRTRTYKDAEPVAHQLLYGMRERGDSNRGLVVATFDNRNHGDRTVSSYA